MRVMICALVAAMLEANALIWLSVAIPYFTFGDDYKMMKQIGFDVVMLSAALFGVLAASMSISEEIEGRSVAEVAQPELRADLVALYREALAGNSAEYEGVRQGRTLQTRVAPVWNDEAIAGGIALIQDVTEERARLAVRIVCRVKRVASATGRPEQSRCT